MAALNEIMKLVEAGFTKDEILAMTAEPEKTPAPAPADPEPEKEPAAPEKQEQAELKKVEPEKESTAQAPAAPAAKPEQKSQLDILIEKVQELSNQVITNNINTQSMDPSKRRTDEDILAAVINPPRAEKKGK